MPSQPILAIRQESTANEHYRIRLTLKRPGHADLEGEATIAFALTAQEQADLRWYLEEYLQRAQSTAAVQVDQIEALMRSRGEELYTKVLAANLSTQAIWFAVREALADLRIEITTPIAEAAAIPWELLRDPQSDSPIAVRVAAFVRVQYEPQPQLCPGDTARRRYRAAALRGLSPRRCQRCGAARGRQPAAPRPGR